MKVGAGMICRIVLLDFHFFARRDCEGAVTRAPGDSVAALPYCGAGSVPADRLSSRSSRLHGGSAALWGISHTGGTVVGEGARFEWPAQQPRR